MFLVFFPSVLLLPEFFPLHSARLASLCLTRSAASRRETKGTRQRKTEQEGEREQEGEKEREV